MGSDFGKPGHFGARHKLGLAWFDSGQEITAATSGGYLLTPLETPSGPKLIRVPRPVEGGYYYIDFRQPIGFDEIANAFVQSLSYPNGMRHDGFRGVHIYNDSDPHGSYALDLTPGSPGPDYYYYIYDPIDGTFKPPQPFIDGVNNVCVYTAPIKGSGATAEAAVFIGCDIDCNSNGVFDAFDLLDGSSTDCNRNGIPDECNGGLTPPGMVLGASPPAWTIDAREPHPYWSNYPGVREGIGSRNNRIIFGYAHGPEPIVITLDVQGVTDPRCWSLCETGIETVRSGHPLSANRIFSVTERGNQPGVYELLLDRPISAGHWTTIRYVGGGDPISYASLPGNANGDMYSSPSDILDLIDCCLNHVCTPRHGFYSCDIDNDGYWTSFDVQRLIDLLNGVGTFIVWNGKGLPANTCIGQTAGGGKGGGGSCTDATYAGCGGGGEPMAMASMSSPGVEGAATVASTGEESVAVGDENTVFADRFAGFLLAADPTDSAAADQFVLLADTLAQWCVENFTPVERAALADRPHDPTLAFASELGAAVASDVCDALSL